ATVNTTFVADSSTATIDAADFSVASGTVANNSATNALSATVKDGQGNPVGNIAVTFAVTSGSATPATQTVSTNTQGVATASLVSAVVGDNAVTASVGSMTTAARTSSFVAPQLTGITVNGTTFAVNAGFPSTGFAQAFFTLNVTGSPSDYTWSSSSSWATVDSSGKVSFTQKGDSTPVTITATLKAGGAALSYTFSVNTWFINNGLTTSMTWSNASNWCATQSATQPTPAQLTQGTSIRGVGSLWSEWGAMGNYSNSGFRSTYYWSSEFSGTGNHYNVHLNNGSVTSFDDSYTFLVACRQGL
ncbi:TPA: Ig-like domain-containing protein, partial [Yersinia enterocolitica]|nr:Ig-like domain-containing protein [Yersinia enterocolitica]